MFNDLYKGLNMTLSMFTKIPLPKYVWDEKSARYIMRLYPLIGLIVGLFWYVSFRILILFNINNILLSALTMLSPLLITGFIHLDGFMDVSDALLSSRDKEEKVRILKDSKVGAFSVIALVILFLVETSSISSLLENGFDPRILILIPITSRCFGGYTILSRDQISKSYFGDLFKKGTKPYEKYILISIYILVILISLVFLNIKYFISLVVLGLVGILSIRKCNKEFSGVNGDVAGFTLVLSEAICFLVLGVI